jgi:hypothetical protein
MPEPARSGPGEFLRRLAARLTPVVRTCLLVGLILGLLIGLYFGLGGPKDEAANIVVEHPAARSVPWIIVGWTLLGAVLGTATGVSVELMFKDAVKADKDKPWWKSGKSARRKK